MTRGEASGTLPVARAASVNATQAQRAEAAALLREAAARYLRVAECGALHPRASESTRRVGWRSMALARTLDETS